MYDDALVLGHDLFHYFLMIWVAIPILLHYNVFDYLFVQLLCVILLLVLANSAAN